jgi:glutamine synthetase type III
MSRIGHDIRLVVVGTKKSQILDVDEEFVLDFTKDEDLREDFSDANDLINNFIETSVFRGDMIRSIVVDGSDLVRNAIIQALNKSSLSANDAFPEVFSLPFLSNADPSDISELVNQVLSSIETDAADEHHDEY